MESCSSSPSRSMAASMGPGRLTGGEPRLQVLHRLAPEERRHPRLTLAGRERAYVQRALEAPRTGGEALHAQRAALGPEPQGDQGRGAGEEVGQVGRGVLQHRVAGEAELGHERRCRARHQRQGGPLRVLADPHHLLRAPPGPCRGGGERPVHRRTHAQGVEARAGREPRQHLRHHLRLEADEPVRHQHHLPLRALPQRLERLDDGRPHLGGAAGPQLRQPGQRRPPRLGRGARRLAPPAAGRVRELDELERVGREERVHQRRDHAARLVERLAAMEPLVSMRTTRSRGNAVRGAPAAGGTRVSRPKPSSPAGAWAGAGGGAVRLQLGADARRGDRPAHHQVAVERRAAPRRLDRQRGARGASRPAARTPAGGRETRAGHPPPARRSP